VQLFQIVYNIGMKKFSRKILPSFLLAAAVLVVGGFFDGMMASAQVGMQTNAPVMRTIRCVAQNQEIQKTLPLSGDTLMPCCIEKHDNSGTIVPSEIQQRVKFSQVLMSKQIDYAAKAIDQKIYPSSPSPPFQAENISCTVLIE